METPTQAFDTLAHPNQPIVPARWQSAAGEAAPIVAHPEPGLLLCDNQGDLDLPGMGLLFDDC